MDKNMNDKLADWHKGRNGADEISNLTLAVAIVLVVVNLFAHTWVISLVAVALLLYTGFRISSTKVADRREENEHFLAVLGPLAPWVRNPAAAMREARAYKHLTCPSCGQHVRVPRGKGKVRVTCPKCKTKFDANA